MRNLKRTLSLVLAALMLMGMMVVGAGAAGVDDFSDKDEIVNKDAVSMLTILGVINGKEDGSYYAPKDNVTRAEMAKMIATILNQGADVNDLYANLETGLTDIDNSWAKGYINYCYSLGIIAGRGNGTFDPTAPVTGNEAAKMLLVAIGYDPEVEGLTGASWAIKTTSLASTLGIFDDLTAPTAENLNRDNAALLIYNALDVEMIQKYEDGYAMIFDDHRTLLSNKYGVYKVEGIVTANEWAELNQTNSEATAKTGKTTLDHVKVYASTTSNTTVAEYVEEKEPVTFNVSTSVDMLGKAVTMYIKKTTVLANSTVLGVTVDDKVNVIEGTVANSSKVTDLLKGTGLSVTDDTEYYVNYGYETASKAAALINNYDWDATGAKFNLNGVDVKLIDNNNDGDVEYVLYIRETLSNVVRTSTKDETVTINVPVVNGNGLLAKNNNTTTTTQVLDNADVVTSMDLAADDLILYVQYGGRTYITEPTIVTGTMTRVDRDKAEELYITVDDGETYKMSYIREVESQVDADITRFYIENAGKNTGAQFDTKYDFILDSNGYIVAFRPAEEVVANYGLVIGSAWTQNALTKAGQIKILSSDSIETTYDIDWKASVGTNKAFATDADLENYLGSRDVHNNADKYRTGAAVGTVIEYSLDDDNNLTIERVMSQNTLNANGTLQQDTANTVKGISISNTGIPVYIDDNRDNDGNIEIYRNMQYTMLNDYKTGYGSITVDASTDGDAMGADPLTFAVDKNTIAFYYDDKDNDGVADSGEYGVAIGWENMGDVKTGVKAQVYPVIAKKGGSYEASKLADVVLFNSVLTNNSANYMLVLNANAVDSKNLELNVVFEDGTTSAITVSKSDYGWFEDDDNYMQAYKYSVNSKGEYTIDTTSGVVAVPASLLENGTVDAGNEYLTIVGTTNIWDVTDVDNANDEVTTGSFDYVTDKWAVVIKTNSNQTLKTAWVWDMDADDGYASSCNFDWSLTNYKTVWFTGTFFDYMQMAEAFEAGMNVKLVGNVDLRGANAYSISIPAGLTVQVEGDLTTGNGRNVVGAGNLRVTGTYNANENIQVATQAMNLVTADNLTINANTHVYTNATLGTTDVYGVPAYGPTTVASGVHMCVKTGELTANNYLAIDGHVEANDVTLKNGGDVSSINTLIVFNDLEVYGTLTIGEDAAGSLRMVNGTISGTGTLVVGDTYAGTLTLSTSSNVEMTGGTLVLNPKGSIQQNYVSNMVMSANKITIDGTIKVPGNVEAASDLVFGTSADGSIGGVFKENKVIVTPPANTVNTGTDSGSITGLALNSLTIKGVAATISGTTATVTLNKTTSTDNSIKAIAYEVTNDAAVTLLDSNKNEVKGTDSVPAGVYTIVLSKEGYTSIAYTLTVTVQDLSSDTSLKSVVVKGQTLTADEKGNYTANLAYNVAYDTTTVQLSVEPTNPYATVTVKGNDPANTTGIADRNQTGIVKDGTVTVIVTSEDGKSTKEYAIEIKVGNTGKVTLNWNDNDQTTLTYQVSGDTTVDTAITFTAQVKEGYENMVVSYSVDGKTWKTLTANEKGEYTLTTAILAEADGKTLYVKAEATEMAKITFDADSSAQYWLTVDGKDVAVDASKGYVYVSKNAEIKVQVKSGVEVKFADAKGTAIPCAPDSSSTVTYDYYILTITGNTTVTIGK